MTDTESLPDKQGLARKALEEMDPWSGRLPGTDLVHGSDAFLDLRLTSKCCDTDDLTPGTK